MAELKRTFTGGKMDKDTDERIVQNGLYREALNISVATSEDSDVGAAQNILGNTKVSEAIQHLTVTGAGDCSGQGNGEFEGDNYHVAITVDPQTDMLYRFVHTPSARSGIWMDRIVEFDTSKNINDAWNEKEKPVFIDIFKVETVLGHVILPIDCTVSNVCTLAIKNNKNINQIRWGMKASLTFLGNIFSGNVISVDYTSGLVALDTAIPDQISGQALKDIKVEFIGDRNLNFDPNVPITGINIIDGMIFWTDNNSEPKKINIEKSKKGSDGTLNTVGGINAGRGTCPIDNFVQHTLLVTNLNTLYEGPTEECRFIPNSCGSAGCTDASAVNYNPYATEDNGSCIASVSGCTDIIATNYDASANTDDGSCCYELGCYNDIFCEYSPSACDGDQNVYCQTIPGCTDSGNKNQTWWENNDYHTKTGIADYPGVPADNVVTDGSVGCDDGSCEYNLIPTWGYDCLNNQACTDDSSLITNPIYLNQTECDLAYSNDGCCGNSVVSGCDIIDSVNYDPLATCNDGSCIPCIYGCMNSDYDEYNANHTCDGGDDANYCFTISGCTNPQSYWYNEDANNDDGSCGTDIVGCTDSAFCNGSSTNFAIYANGNTPDPQYTACTGTPGCLTIGDSNYDAAYDCHDANDCSGIYLGCTDVNANNYDSGANQNDGSCTYDPVYACLDTAYVEYDATLCNGHGGCTNDPNLCITLISSVSGCMDNTAYPCDGDVGAIAGCYDPLYTHDCNEVLGGTDDTCCQEIIEACDDNTANANGDMPTNYHDPANWNTANNSLCIYPEPCPVFDVDLFTSIPPNQAETTYWDPLNPTAGSWGYDKTIEPIYYSFGKIKINRGYTNVATTSNAAQLPLAEKWYLNGVQIHTNTPNNHVWYSTPNLNGLLAGFSPFHITLHDFGNADPTRWSDYLGDGTYTYTLEDINGCPADPGNVSVEVTSGCLDPTANNYCATCNLDRSLITSLADNATAGDFCTYSTGCLDATACNNDCLPGNFPSAGSTSCGDGIATDDGITCSYPPTNYNCSGGCASPATLCASDGNCYAPPILACTDPNALNYVSTANCDDGSCIYAVDGCTNNTTGSNPDINGACVDLSSCTTLGCCGDGNGYLAENYNSAATNDDGSCLPNGCTDSTADNYDPAALSDDGNCEFECNGTPWLNNGFHENEPGSRLMIPWPGAFNNTWRYIDTNISGGTSNPNSAATTYSWVHSTNPPWTVQNPPGNGPAGPSSGTPLTNSYQSMSHPGTSLVLGFDNTTNQLTSGPSENPMYDGQDFSITVQDSSNPACQATFSLTIGLGCPFENAYLALVGTSSGGNMPLSHFPMSNGNNYPTRAAAGANWRTTNYDPNATLGIVENERCACEWETKLPSGVWVAATPQGC